MKYLILTIVFVTLFLYSLYLNVHLSKSESANLLTADDVDVSRRGFFNAAAGAAAAAAVPMAANAEIDYGEHIYACTQNFPT